MSAVDASRPLARIESVCHAPFRGALEAIDTSLSTGLVAALETGRELHDELVKAAGLPDEPPEGWAERGERLVDYRRRLATDVLEPMRVVFRRSSPGTIVVDELTRALREAREGARGLSASMEDTWPPGALDPRPGEAAARKIRKAAGRMVSAARKAGAPRTVPLRAVALHHLGEKLAPALDTTTSSLLQEWAAWERELELVWVEWGDQALPALVRSELPRSADERTPEGQEGGEEQETPWATVRAAAEALNDRLARLIADCPLPRLLHGIDAALDEAHEALEADLAVAGSFVFTPADTHRIEPALPRLQSLKPALERWEQGVDSRLHVYEALLAILAGATAVQRRLVYRVRDEHLAGAAVLTEVAADLEDLARELPDRPESRSALQAHLDRLDSRVEQVLQPTADALPESSRVDATIQSRANATVEALLAMIRQAPSSLELHAEDGRLPRGGRKVETRSLALQELARQSFDALRIERIRSSTSGLVGAIDEVRADIDELPNVFAFARDAARKELEEGAEGARDRTKGLVEEALLSMSESLRNADRALATAVLEAQTRLAKEVSDGSLALIDRVAAGRMQARLLAARSWLADASAWAVDRWGPTVQSALRSLEARWKVFRRIASRGLRKGTEMVGAGTADKAAAARTLRRLSDAGALLDDLPLVYQRLFTLEPIDDPSLLAGRGAELTDAMGRWHRWRSADGIPLMVRGRPGSGITSFVNVLAAEIAKDDGTVAPLSIDDRIDDEASLARLLADVLGVGEARTLDELARAVFRAPKGAVPDAVLVDNLEHLYLRVPRGTDLIERLLTLMAETEPRIFWIGGVTSSAWQLIATAEPTAVSQVDVLELAQLPEAGLREAMTLRHRRSGLPLRFEEPDSSRRMLRQRLRRLRDRGGYDDLLADDFFGRLERTSSRHLRLALFQWLVAADFGQAEGVVMHAPERPDFSVLDSLALTQNFTLKAFLEHRTLTLEEHDRIFRLPRHESYQIFESLQNRQLIESVVSDDDTSPDRSEIEEDLRYRVRPLLVGAVISHLRGRNIFH